MAIKNNLDIDDVATLLHIPAAKVHRWVQQGQIPCKFRGKRCYFKEKDIIDWAKSHDLMVFDDTEKSESQIEASLNLKSGIERGGVYFDLKGDNVPSVLTNAIEHISFSSHIDKRAVLKALLNREEITSTGIGRGVAIPHPRHPIPVAYPLIPVFFLEKSIDFQSIDGMAVFVIFIMFSPSTQIHLKLLSKLSFFLREDAFLASLRACRTPEEVFSLIEKYEAKLE